jgi:hypothetical protein
MSDDSIKGVTRSRKVTIDADPIFDAAAFRAASVFSLSHRDISS